MMSRISLLQQDAFLSHSAILQAFHRSPVPRVDRVHGDIRSLAISWSSAWTKKRFLRCVMPHHMTDAVGDAVELARHTIIDAPICGLQCWRQVTLCGHPRRGRRAWLPLLLRRTSCSDARRPRSLPRGIVARPIRSPFKDSACCSPHGMSDTPFAGSATAS